MPWTDDDLRSLLRRHGLELGPAEFDELRAQAASVDAALQRIPRWLPEGLDPAPAVTPP
jgi:hypothetical protein